MPYISVVLPVYNGASTLEKAIQSIVNQDTNDWELIVIEDGSVDNSLEIAESLAVSDSRIRVFSQPHSGIVNALNHGIQLCRGKYIARMDADDVSFPKRLRLQKDFLDNNPDIGLVGCLVNFAGNREEQLGYATYVDWSNSLVSRDSIYENRFVESPFPHPSVMFRSKLVEEDQSPYKKGDFPEDYELFLRWMSQGVKMQKLPETLLDWHDSPTRLSRMDPRYEPYAFYRTKAHYLAEWILKETDALRPIWIWGAGRRTRQRAAFLLEYGIAFEGFIDLDPLKAGGDIKGLPVIVPQDLDLSQNPVIISYVSNRGAREKIRRYLLGRGLVEQVDFVIAA